MMLLRRMYRVRVKGLRDNPEDTDVQGNGSERERKTKKMTECGIIKLRKSCSKRRNQSAIPSSTSKIR